MYNKSIKYLFVVLCFLTSSCEKWLTIQPAEMLTKNEMFLTEGGFHDALMGSYVLLQNQYGSVAPMTTSFIEHLACQWQVESQGDPADLNEHIYNKGNIDGTLEDIFKSQYKTIVNLNLLLENIETQKGVLDEVQYNNYKGQALAMRAFIHFDLIRVWGPMPKRVSREHKYIPYMTYMSVNYNQALTYPDFMTKLLTDLDEAEKCFLKYESSAPDEKQRAFFNCYSVYAQKARYYSWMQESEKAVFYAKKIIDCKTPNDKVTNEVDLKPFWTLGNYKDIANGDLQFLTEHIIHLTFDVKDKSTSGTNDFYNEATYVLELFKGSGSDIRRNQWVARSEKPGEEPTVTLNKYVYVTETGTTIKGTTPLLRLAEMYLIAIEHGALVEVDKYHKEFCIARNIQHTTFIGDIDRQEWLMDQYRLDFVSEGQLFFAYKRWETVDMPRCASPCGPVAYVVPLPNKENNLN